MLFIKCQVVTRLGELGYFICELVCLRIILLTFLLASFFTAHKKKLAADTLLNNHLSPDRDWTEDDSAPFSTRLPVCDLRNEFERVALDCFSGAEDTADSGLGCLSVSASEGFDESSLGPLAGTEREEDDSGSEEYHTADEDIDAECQARSRVGLCTPARGTLNHSRPRSREEDDLSSSVSSCSSFKSTYSTPEHPEEFQTEGFLTG